jgi:hypothetical protein
MQIILNTSGSIITDPIECNYCIQVRVDPDIHYVIRFPARQGRIAFRTWANICFLCILRCLQFGLFVLYTHTVKYSLDLLVYARKVGAVETQINDPLMAIAV